MKHCRRAIRAAAHRRYRGATVRLLAHRQDDCSVVVGFPKIDRETACSFDASGGANTTSVRGKEPLRLAAGDALRPRATAAR
jgi:hypothetical protein